MLFSANLTQLALAVSGLFAVSANASSCCEGKAPHVDFQKLAKNYMALWGGNMTLVDSVIHPDVSLAGDRLPAANGSTTISITNREQYIAFIDKSRSGWAEYDFDILHLVSNKDQFAVRWRMNGITSANMTTPTTLSAGSSVTYNGTDFAILDECTGLVKEIYMSQDFITYFHNLGLTSVNV